jgi:hypothetical protein
MTVRARRFRDSGRILGYRHPSLYGPVKMWAYIWLRNSTGSRKRGGAVELSAVLDKISYFTRSHDIRAYIAALGWSGLDIVDGGSS